MTAKRGYEKHGGANTRAYKIWLGMLARCYDTNKKHYARYGGRGITVCDEWKDSFAAFLKDMGHPPEKYTLERKDNDKGYCKDNCRWATRREQSFNTSKNVPMTINGTTKSMAEWAFERGLPYDLVYWRKQRAKWSDEKCLAPSTRKPKMVFHHEGKDWTVPEIAAKLGIAEANVYVRIRAGWPVEDIINRPNSQPYMKTKHNRGKRLGSAASYRLTP